MDRFVGFLLRRWLVAILVVTALMLGALGYAQQGVEIWKFGPPGWLFQLFGFVLFAGVVSYLLFEWDEKLEGLLSGKSDLGGGGSPRDPVEDAMVLRAQETDQIAHAIQVGGNRFYYDATEYPATLAKLRSALATARKSFGIEPPILPDDAVTAIKTATEFLQQIHPFLAQGHDDEAQEAARDYIGGK